VAASTKVASSRPVSNCVDSRFNVTVGVTSPTAAAAAPSVVDAASPSPAVTYVRRGEELPHTIPVPDSRFEIDGTAFIPNDPSLPASPSCTPLFSFAFLSSLVTRWNSCLSTKGGQAKAEGARSGVGASGSVVRAGMKGDGDDVGGSRDVNKRGIAESDDTFGGRCLRIFAQWSRSSTRTTLVPDSSPPFLCRWGFLLLFLLCFVGPFIYLKLLETLGKSR